MSTPADLEWLYAARQQVREAELNEDQRKVAQTILDYLVPGTSWAWIPNHLVFRSRCKMDKANVSKALKKLQVYGIIQVEPSAQPMFPEGRRYTFFLNNAAKRWGVPPRVRSGSALERTDRWLRALNAGGGPEQGEFFNFASELTAALADLNREEGFEPDTPDARSSRSSSPEAQPPSRSAPAAAGGDAGEERGVGPEPTPSRHDPATRATPDARAGQDEDLAVGLKPTPPHEPNPPSEFGPGATQEKGVGVGLKPTAVLVLNQQGVGSEPTAGVGLKPTPKVLPDLKGIEGIEGIDENWSGLDESNISLRPLQKEPAREAAVGLKPTPEKYRPAHWPTWQTENRLMRELWEFFRSFVGEEGARLIMEGDGTEERRGYGKQWRWRIREFPFCVEQAVKRVEACRREVKSVGGALNIEFIKAQRAWLKKQRERREAEEEEG